MAVDVTLTMASRRLRISGSGTAVDRAYFPAHAGHTGWCLLDGLELAYLLLLFYVFPHWPMLTPPPGVQALGVNPLRRWRAEGLPHQQISAL